MASPTKPPPRRGRRLCELLEEQQEPLLLDVYLLENVQRERRNLMPLQAAIFCWSSSNVHRFLPSLCLKLRPGRFRQCTKFLRKVLHCATENTKVYNLGCWRDVGSENHAKEFHPLNQEEQSPVSDLKLHSDEAAEKSSTLTRSSQVKEASQIIQELISCSEREWLESKKLLLGCMEGRSRGSMLIASDFSKTRKQWSHHQTEVQEIGREIEYAIFEKMSEEALEDMLDFHCIFERF